jgi:hypothetical protein
MAKDKEREEIKFLTNDSIADPAGRAGGRKKTKLDAVDQEIYRQSVTGEGLIKIESADQLKELAQMAALTKQAFDEDAARLMNFDRAAEVRRLRVDEGFSWRAVAHACHDAWFTDMTVALRDGWWPPSNQLMGIALCEAAARMLFEDANKPPWN